MSPDGSTDMNEGRLVDTEEAFGEVCRELAEQDRIGFDAEFVAEEGYGVQVCLIQVASPESVYLIDPLAGFDIRPFWELVADGGIEKVVHAGLEDLAICFHETGRVPQNVFDVQIAAGLVGQDYPMSLQRLARATVGARLHKTQTLTNWRKRPLSPEQIRYAVKDVAYLLPIHAKLLSRLEARSRTEWAHEEFARFTRPETYRQEDRALYRRIRGAGSLDRRGLSILRELAAERDALARSYDRPPRAVIKDHLMIAIARHGLTEVKDLRSLRGLGLRAEGFQRTAAAVRRGLESPRDTWPEAFAVEDDTLQEATMRKLISAVLTDYCHAEGIAVQLFWTNRDVRALVLSHTRDDSSLDPGQLQSGWRARAVGGLVGDILAGRRSIRVVSGDGAGTLLIE